MRIVFMGTPDYSVPTISKLLESGHNIAGVFAQPDKPVGRKHVLTPPATKVFAIENDIPVFQPVSLRDPSALDIIKKLDPEIIVVVAYGKILPKEILDYPKYGAINGHASILPEYRGASPIQWAIISGERETGVTVMQMDVGMDTGDILAVSKTEILPDETAGQLFERLSLVTASLIDRTLFDIKHGNISPVKQDDSKATYAPIITKEMAHLDFTVPAEKLCFAVRGYNPWPMTFCNVCGRRLKVISATTAADVKSKAPGTVAVADKRLIIGCGDGTAIEFLTVQPEGGKPMSAAEFLRGNKINVGTVVE